MARPGLHNNRKFKRLLLQLGDPRPHVRGYLELLWDSAYETGNPIIGNKDDVELTAEYPGEPGKLFTALLSAGGSTSAGFIEPASEEGTYQIHDLHENAPEYVKKRWKRELERKNKDLAPVLSGQRRTTADNGAPPAPAPAPAPAPINSPAAAGGLSGAKKTPPNANHRLFVEFFCCEWAKCRGAKYTFLDGKDGAAAGRILSACGNDLDKAKRIVASFLSTSDPFYAEQGYSIAFLSTRMNKFLPEIGQRRSINQTVRRAV